MEWDSQLGFEIQEEHNHVRIFPQLKNYIENCSVPELEEFLSGAPLQICCLFLYQLPYKKALKVVESFRIADFETLKYAYRHPPQIAAPKPPEETIDTFEVV